MPSLSGIRVVDFATVLSGPFAAMLLADQGADVIKLETPDGGDSARRLVSVPGTDDLSIGFLAFNRNKRSVTLDITRPEGKEAAYRLLQWADVLIINMRVDTRRRRGFTYEELAAINPRLIYVSLTAYGDEGPDADQGGVDIRVQARIGDITGRQEPGSPPPSHTMLFHFDMATSMLIAYAVTLALRDRERTGLGQKIETSLLQTGVSLHAIQTTRVLGLEQRYPSRPTGPTQIFRCADGRYIRVPAWEGLCETLQLNELTHDPRFDSAEHREQNAAALTEILAPRLLQKPAAEWESMFKAAGHRAGMLRTAEEVFDDPQVIANNMIAQFEQPGVGEVQAVGLPFQRSATADVPWLRSPAPHLGQHTHQVLLGLGYSQEEIAALGEGGVLG